jgi:tagatose-1,6-bisphosphate aldolase non-catalytic subunit AgaZ/GatZ
MSTNCIDASIELATEYDIPIMLIASRRQIDSGDFGGGYVNNWTTEQFSTYVLDKDKSGNVILCRDHGGPWQNSLEKEQNLGLTKALDSAKLSFQEDIESGFQIIHIDPSVDIHKQPTMENIVDRVLELYEFCWETALKCNRKIEFEIGTEEQSGSTSSAIEFQNMLKQVNRHCEKYKMPKPLFTVVQNGTKVMETKNVGSFDLPVRVANEVPPEIQVPLMSRICRENGVFMKAHNTDYLSDASLQWYPRLGIHAANVAPEFGVVETRALLTILRENNLCGLEEEFIQLSLQSKKWEKWMLTNSIATEYDKAVIAGHYVFATEGYKDIVKQAEEILSCKGINLNTYLKNQVKDSILRYLIDFRMVKR